MELTSLTEEDFKRILTEPTNALLKQYKALLATEGVSIEFTDDAIERLAQVACEVNEQNGKYWSKKTSYNYGKIIRRFIF